MDSYQKIEQLREEVSRLQQELTALRTRKTKIQDASLKKILQKEITEMIEAIDGTETELANEEAKLPEKRTNGHHPPEAKRIWNFLSI